MHDKLKMINQKLSNKSGGFTIVEVLIFVAISSIVLVSVISLSVTITRQTYINIHKFYATRYADELAEWLRAQKELDWQGFHNTVRLYGTSFTRCVNTAITLTDSLNILSTSPCPYTGITTSPQISPQIYSRTVRFTKIDNSQVDTLSNSQPIKAQIVVAWLEIGGTPYNVTIETLLAPR